jgi:hypothetical protein
MAENGPDFIHLRTVHGAADVPELESYELEGYATRLRSRVNFATPRGPRTGRIDTDSWGPGFSLARFSGILAACFVSAQTPIDFEWTEVSFTYPFHQGDGADAARAARLGAALIADLKRQEEEDILIFDHKIYQPTPRLARRRSDCALPALGRAVLRGRRSARSIASRCDPEHDCVHRDPA